MKSRIDPETIAKAMKAAAVVAKTGTRGTVGEVHRSETSKALASYERRRLLISRLNEP